MKHFTDQIKQWRFLPVVLQIVQLGIYYLTFFQAGEAWKEGQTLWIALGSALGVLGLLQLLVLGLQGKFDTEKENACTKNALNVSEAEYLRFFSEHFGLTSREAEVFERLVTSEAGVQEIADELYISRRNLQRHIASVYEKTNTKSRIGLFQCYARFRWGRDSDMGFI